MADLKSLNPATSQIILRKLGMYSSERLSVDIYYLLEAIYLIIGDVGEEEFKKICEKEGKDFEHIQNKLQDLSKNISKVKTFYDPIENKVFEKKDTDRKLTKTQSLFKKYFIRTASKVSLIQKDLYDIFAILVRNTTLQRQQIPSEAFKILEHTGFRKVEITRKPTTTETIHPT